ncbi:MAG: hypothetical protein ACTIJJ_07685 [Galactobacter sp.]
MTGRRHRGSRRYEAQPTHLPGQPATGDVDGWLTRQADREAEAQALTGTPGHTGSDATDAGRGGKPAGEDQAKVQAEDSRAAWFREQRPPHWG